MKLSPGILVEIKFNHGDPGDEHETSVVLCLPEMPHGPRAPVMFLKSVITMLLKEILSPQADDDPPFIASSMLILAYLSKQSYRALTEVSDAVEKESESMSDTTKNSLIACSSALAKQIRMSSYLMRCRMIEIGRRKRDEIEDHLRKALDEAASRLGLGLNPELIREEQESILSGLDAVLSYLGTDVEELLDPPMLEAWEGSGGGGGVVH